jgi:hypothetical protein
MGAPAASTSLPSRRLPSARPPAPVSGADAVYRRRDPTSTALYPIVQHHLESFLAHAPDADPLPGWVEEDFRSYLRCGILAHGFARARCNDCGAERLIAFSCKGRAVCPSCNTRRMVEVAAHLSDAVLPPLPVRQWVFSLPKRLRPFLPRDPALASAVLRILLSAIRTLLRTRCPDAPAHGQLGAVSFLHRFGSTLNPHFHFHLVVLDGLFAEGPDGSVRFHPVGDPGSNDLHRLQQTLRRRVLRLFLRRQLLDEPTVENMLTWQAAGGFSLDASVRIRGDDRAGRERLLRPCARPPFALERLRIKPAAPLSRAGSRSVGAGVQHVLYQPSRPTPQGRTLLVLSPIEFLAALARLIPPPRVHRHRYHGVLAPHAALRERVTALARDDTTDLSAPAAADPASDAAAPQSASPPPGPADPAAGPPHPSAARSRWARLLARVYEVFPLSCPDCGAEMRILAFLTEPFTVAGILRHLTLPTSAPPLSPARSPPPEDPDFDADPFPDLDETPAFDPTEPEAIPEFDFDQTLGA